MPRTYRVACVVLASLCAACATLDPQREKNRQLAAAHVYERPIAEVWAEVKGLLAALEYTYKEEPGAFVLVTEFQEQLDGADAVSVWRRYLVKAHALDGKRTVVRFFKHELAASAEGIDSENGHVTVTTGQAQRGEFNPRHNGAIRYKGRNRPSMKRDLTMEWELVRRIEGDTPARPLAAGGPQPD